MGATWFENDGLAQQDSAFLTLGFCPLDEDACFRRIEREGHGVLATLHSSRGVDAVPVVFACDRGRIFLPVDTLKPKRSTTLQRTRNIEADPRCVLLVDHYSDDWDELWWVRVHGRASVCSAVDLEGALPILAARHPQYLQPGSVAEVLALEPVTVTGWEARPRASQPPGEQVP